MVTSVLQETLQVLPYQLPMGTSLGGNLTVVGNVTSAALSSHNVTIDNLHANNTILNGNLSVTGNITGNTLSVTNGVSFGGNLSVAGNVTSAALSSHNATIDNLHANNTILNGDLTVTGNITGNTFRSPMELHLVEI
jgi:hypothetical protein